MAAGNTVVNTNVMALNTHRSLKNVGNTQAKASERLSSGLRINSAADDAAGLAISEKMRAQIRGLDMASKNSQDAISLIQTAEGGMQEIDNMLQRIRELVDYASNDTQENNSIGTGDRQKIQDEIDQLTAEIDSMAGRVEFNKKKVIDGSYSDPRELLSSAQKKLEGMSSKLANATNVLTSAVDQQTKAAADMTNAQSIMTSYESAINAQKTNLANAINALETATYAATGDTNATALDAALQSALVDIVAKAKSDPRGITSAYLEGIFSKYFTPDVATGENTDGVSIASVGDSFSLTIAGWGGTTAPTITFANDDGSGLTDTTTAFATSLTSLFQAAAKVAGEQAVLDRIPTKDATSTAVMGSAAAQGFFNTPSSLTGTATGNETNTNIDDIGKLTKYYSQYTATKISADIKVAQETKNVDAINEQIATYQAQVAAAKQQVALLGTNTPGLYFQVGANANQGLQTSIGSVKTDVLGIGDGKGASKINVVRDTGADITRYLDTLDEALSYVTTERSKLGAAQNRLEYTIKSLDISSENLSSAESRIRDTDMAKEMMNYTKANVLQQAAISMLAQANQAPQNLLSLLR